MNNLIPPFKDPRVRLAFNMAVDKADVVELTLFGQGAPTISPIPPTHPFYAKELAPGPADPAGARKLLAASRVSRTGSRCRSSCRPGGRCGSGSG